MHLPTPNLPTYLPTYLPVAALWEQTMQIVLDTPEPKDGTTFASIGSSVTEDFTCIYSKQWSAANMAGGMAFQK